MSLELKISSIIFLLLVVVIILSLVRKNNISIKYSFVWLVPCFILFVFTLVPGALKFVTNLLGFQTASNMILAILVGFLMIIAIALTVIVSRQNEKIRLLMQEVSILKKK